MKGTEHLNFTHARTKEQRELMERIAQDGVCPFCWEHFTTYHPKPIEEQSDWWIVTENISPYEGTTTHLLFVYKEHVVTPADISEQGWTGLRAVLTNALARHSILHGSFFMRFGNMEATGSSVAHLHAHLIVGKPYNESLGEKIRVKLGYK